MNISFQQLIIFRDLNETKSITQTAERLHLTQPAVSIQLKNFQLQFDRALYETIGKKIYITEFGKEVYLKSQVLLKEAEEIQRWGKSNKGEIQGLLKIAVVSTGKYVMPYFLTDFIKANPDVEIHMDVSNKEQVIERLKRNEVDFALVSILPEKLNLKKIDLIENRLYMVGFPQKKTLRHALKTMTSLSPLIYREPGSGTRQTMEKFIERKKIVPIKPIELTSNEAVKQALLAGMGYSIMPLIGLKNEILSKQLQIIPITGLPIKTTWQLVWLTDKKHGLAASEFQRYLRENKNNILKKYFDWYLQFKD
jgi:DNA-binding transcriptional LysR family regulator